MKRKLTADGLGHVVIGAMALAVVLASVMLTPSESAVSLWGWDVPPLCLFKIWSGHDCPGCGLTRSFTYMGNGLLMAAWDRHRLGPPLYVFVFLQVPWRAWKIGALRRQGRLMTDGDAIPVGADSIRD